MQSSLKTEADFQAAFAEIGSEPVSAPCTNRPLMQVLQCDADTDPSSNI